MKLFTAVTFAALIVVVALGWLQFVLDQRTCPGCGSGDSYSYPEHRVCRHCGKVWR